MDKALKFVSYRGAEIESVFEDLGKLRIAVFKDYPYLYEGTLEHEMEYLKIYSSAPKSFVFGVYDGSEMVGATTCIPLSEETSEVQKPFIEAGYDIEKIFYFGESILLPAYRGKGIGHRFFDEREAHASSFGSYDYTAFCSVDRGEKHPLKPLDYRPNDAFWLKRNYSKKNDLVCEMTWLDVDNSEPTSKPLIFWMKGSRG